MEHKVSELNAIPEKKQKKTKVQNQELIEEAYSCLTMKILQVAENSIHKTSTGIKRIPPVT